MIGNSLRRTRLRGSRDGNGLFNKAKFGFLRRSVVLVGRETSQAITAALGSGLRRISGALLPPSPPADEASSRQDQTRQFSTGGHMRRQF
jgi:hypothetical protein